MSLSVCWQVNLQTQMQDIPHSVAYMMVFSHVLLTIHPNTVISSSFLQSGIKESDWGERECKQMKDRKRERKKTESIKLINGRQATVKYKFLSNSGSSLGRNEVTRLFKIQLNNVCCSNLKKVNNSRTWRVGLWLCPCTTGLCGEGHGAGQQKTRIKLPRAIVCLLGDTR